MARQSQRTRLAFTVSMVVHGAAAVALTFYILVEKSIIPNPFTPAVFLPPPPPKAAPRPRVMKRLPTPIVRSETPLAIEPQVAVRATASTLPKTSSVRATSVLQSAPRAVAVNVPILTPRVRVVRPNTETPAIVTNADLPVADSADALAYSAPVVVGVGGGPKVGRAVGVAAATQPTARMAKPRGISLVQHVGAALDGMGTMAELAAIGYETVLPLPAGDPGSRVVGTYGDIRGVFRLVRVKHDLSDWWADVVDPYASTRVDARPASARVLPNYPNPFNPETWLPFELSEASVVSLVVYDVKGRVVRTLDLGRRNAGYHVSRTAAAYWDGRNALGESVGSGVYFYELRAGGARSVGSMTILK